MGKFSNHNKLSKKEQQELFINFSFALSSVKDPVEAANLIKDLLSEQEAIMLARRLQIADLLIQGLKYREIKKIMKVTDPTIARVQTWLRLYGEGYRTIVERTSKKQKNISGAGGWRELKKRYPLYFWPQIVLKEIISSANAKQRKRLLAVLGQMKEKTQLSKELTQLLNFDKNLNTV